MTKVWHIDRSAFGCSRQAVFNIFGPEGRENIWDIPRTLCAKDAVPIFGKVVSIISHFRARYFFREKISFCHGEMNCKKNLVILFIFIGLFSFLNGQKCLKILIFLSQCTVKTKSSKSRKKKSRKKQNANTKYSNAHFPFQALDF